LLTKLSDFIANTKKSNVVQIFVQSWSESKRMVRSCERTEQKKSARP
jgi:hypothetical protein